MVGPTQLVVATAALLSVLHAHPLNDFQFTQNTAWVVKRKLYNLDEIKDKDHNDKLVQGLKDAVTIAAKTLEKMDDTGHKDKLKGWFGDKPGDHTDEANARELIRQVFKNFVGKNPDGTGDDVNGDVVVYKDDYWKPDGQTLFCDLVKDDKKGAAYYMKHPDQKKPGMHYCDKVWARGNLADLTKDTCKDLGDTMDTEKMTKNFIGANVLHEFMHYPKVGKEALGSMIVDAKDGYGASECRKLATDNKVETLTNADTYVWYALHIALEELCGKKFKYPEASANIEPPDDAAPQGDQPPAPQPPQPKRKLVVGLEQIGSPRCTTVSVPLPNSIPSTSCSEQHDYINKYFFYTLENVEDVDSLCTSFLPDFYQDEVGRTDDPNLFEHPTWPKNSYPDSGVTWNLKLFGEDYAYKNDNQGNPGALWKGDQVIACSGDLSWHDAHSDEWCENTLTKSEGTSRKRRRLVECKW